MHIHSIKSTRSAKGGGGLAKKKKISNIFYETLSFLGKGCKIMTTNYELFVWMGPGPDPGIITMKEKV